jgi:hypothetical protein
MKKVITLIEDCKMRLHHVKDVDSKTVVLDNGKVLTYDEIYHPDYQNHEVHTEIGKVVILEAI